MAVLSGIEPERVFHYFEEISKISRPSYHEKAISDYVVAFARENGLEYYQDELFNVIVIKNATPGYEDEEPIILQGHLDMVCEKTEETEIDFLRDPLKLRVQGDLISAEETTLGGDDGIAVAYALAILSDHSLSHPRLEVVLTVSEEVGMEGAKGIDLSMLKGHRLLNLDSEEEGVLLSSCAGGSTAFVDLPVEREAFSGKNYRIEITGLLGGHSGSEIHKERANANLLLARLLLSCRGKIDVRLSSMEGGAKQNAIPRQSFAEVAIPDGAEEELQGIVDALQEAVKNEYAISDPDIKITMTPSGTPELLPLSKASMERVVASLAALPNGIQAMSSDIPGLVKTSLNLGILSLENHELHLEYAVRSSVETERKYLEQRLLAIAAAFGGKAQISAEYPAWEFQPESPFRADLIAVYRELTGKEPKVEAIHAGVECGILAGKIQNLDGVSIGPDMWDVHTTEERLSISSTARVYEFITAMLARKHGKSA